MKNHSKTIVVNICLLFIIILFVSRAPANPTLHDDIITTGLRGRLPRWAVPIKRPGLPNFHKVSGALYRGAQPTKEGFRELEKMGIRTVINLRSFHSDRDEMKGANLGYEHMKAKAWHAEDHEVAKFMRIVTDGRRLPVFVHCKHGADRTGQMCAVYRIAVQGWSKKDALREMTKGAFGYHKVWKNLIRYIEDLDVAEMKRKAGL